MATNPNCQLCRAISTVVISIGLLLSYPARAISQCTFVSVVGTNFGSYDPISGATVDSTGAITINCTNVQPSDTITITLSKGSSTSYLPRQMLSGANVLQYNLYLDAARTSVWGDGTGGTSEYGPSNPPNGTNLSLSVYGRIPASQTTVVAGSYSDTIVVTVNF